MTTQLEFTSAKATQSDRILLMLQSRRGEWVDMPCLARVGADNDHGFCMVHSRVADLRKRGHTIEHRNERVGGRCHSFYRLNGLQIDEVNINQRQD